jgi:hypothetical protein
VVAARAVHASLREELGVAAEARSMILIGKDGGIKKRTALETDLRAIFLLIDAMRMGREETCAKEEAGLSVTSP